MTSAAVNKPPLSALAVVALVATVLCWPVGLILSIVALVRISNSNGALGGKTLAIVSLCLGVAFVPVAGCMAAIAVPNFVKFQCRSKQSEARSNLKSLYIAEESFRAEHNSYSPDPAAIGFAPLGAVQRYDYAVVSAGESAFVAEAKAKADREGELRGDHWRIDEKGALQNVVNGCER